MAKVMQPGALARTGCPQTSLPRQRVERTMNAANIQSGATVGDEHVGGTALAQELFATLKVVGEYRAGGRMNGYQTGPTKLGSLNRQHVLIEIDIAELQIERLGDP